MRYFVRHTWPEWDSKLNILSMAVAGRIGGEYWRPGVTGGVVVQVADGMCDVPPGCTPFAAIMHDPVPCAYAPKPILRIGLGDVPGCTINLSSYPLREKDMHRLPVSVKFDAVVGGSCPSVGECEDAIERAGLSGSRVAVAIPGNPGVAAEVAASLEAGGNEVTLVDDPRLPVLSVLYRTCPTVVHLGHCRRGYLHSLAMYHASVPGRRLVERVAGQERFEVATVADLTRFLVG